MVKKKVFFFVKWLIFFLWEHILLLMYIIWIKCVFLYSLMNNWYIVGNCWLNIILSNWLTFLKSCTEKGKGYIWWFIALHNLETIKHTWRILNSGFNFKTDFSECLLKCDYTFKLIIHVTCEEIPKKICH